MAKFILVFEDDQVPGEVDNDGKPLYGVRCDGQLDRDNEAVHFANQNVTAAMLAGKAAQRLFEIDVTARLTPYVCADIVFAEQKRRQVLKQAAEAAAATGAPPANDAASDGSVAGVDTPPDAA